jgi:hypothetical protein
MPIIINTSWSDITASGVTIIDKKFGDVPESGTGGLSSQSPYAEATVYYYIPWSQRWTFVQAILGSPQASDFADTSALVYRLPVPYPDNEALYASAFEIHPIPSPSGTNSAPSSPETAYNYAVVAIKYSTPTYPVTGDNPLVTIEGASGAQEITAPLFSYAFSDGSKPEQPVGILIPNQEIRMTYHRVPYINTDIFTSYQGMVNSATFLGLDVGTVFCNPITWSTSITVNQYSLFEVQFSFSWRALPWNQFIKPNGAVDTLTNVATGDPVFASVDFNDLFS